MVMAFSRHKLLWIALVGCFVIVGSGAALLRAQDSTTTADPPSASATVPGGPPMYPADDNAIKYTDLQDTASPGLTDEEAASGSQSAQRYTETLGTSRATINAEEQWAETDNGYAVHQAWAGYSAAMAEQAAAQHAAEDTGLAAIGDVGVVP